MFPAENVLIAELMHIWILLCARIPACCWGTKISSTAAIKKDLMGIGKSVIAVHEMRSCSHSHPPTPHQSLTVSYTLHSVCLYCFDSAITLNVM